MGQNSGFHQESSFAPCRSSLGKYFIAHIERIYLCMKAFAVVKFCPAANKLRTGGALPYRFGMTKERATRRSTTSQSVATEGTGCHRRRSALTEKISRGEQTRPCASCAEPRGGIAQSGEHGFCMRAVPKVDRAPNEQCSHRVHSVD